MLSVTGLIEEIRTSYGSSVHKYVLEASKLIEYINSGLMELSKEGFLDFSDSIELLLTTDRDYFLGASVHKIRQISVFDPTGNVYNPLSEYDYASLGISVRNSQHLWFDKPVLGRRYKVDVITRPVDISRDFFVDVATVMLGSSYKLGGSSLMGDMPNVKMQGTGNVQVVVAELLDLSQGKATSVVLDTLYKRKQLLYNNQAMLEIIDLTTKLRDEIVYYETHMSYIIFSALEQIFVEGYKSLTSANALTLLYFSVEKIEINSEPVPLPSWVSKVRFLMEDINVMKAVVVNLGGELKEFVTTADKIVVLSSTGNFSSQVFLKSVTGDLLTATQKPYAFEDVLKLSVNSLLTRYHNSLNGSFASKVVEFRVLHELAVGYNNLVQERRFTNSKLKESQVQLNLGATKDFIDMPSVFKDALLYYVSNRIMLAFNSNANEFNTMYYKAFKEEVRNLKALGYRPAPLPDFGADKFKSGLI